MMKPECMRFSTVLLLLAATVSCSSPSLLSLPVEQSAEPTLEAIVSQEPVETLISVKKPPRGRSTPVPAQNGQGQTQGQDNAPVQDLMFTDVPAHTLDVILGRPTDSSIMLSVLAYASQQVTVAYGTTSGAYDHVFGPLSLLAGVPRLVELRDLQPDTLYYYRIQDVENSFHTARLPGSSFTFTVQADSHLDSNTDPQVYWQTLVNERADRPDFVIDLGDTFMTEKYKPYTDAESQYLAQRYYLGQVAQAAPLFLVLGNHDGEGAPRGPAQEDISAWAAGMRTTYFPNPVPDGFYTGDGSPDAAVGDLQDYYAWTWGDALFVVLDPYWFTPRQEGAQDLWNQTLGYEQYQWLKETLESSGALWKFVFIHQLIGGKDQNGRGGIEIASLYEWGGHNADGTYGFDTHRPGWGLPIHPLLTANDVTAVFHGHDHIFAEEELNGIIYLEVPQPGASRANDVTKAVEYGYLTGDVLGSPGHVRVTVAADKVTFEYIRSCLPEDETAALTNGQVDYRYILSH